MKPNKVLMFTLRLILGVVVVLLIWNPLVNLAFVFAQGQDPSFEMGDNYEMSGPGRPIIYWPSEDRENYGFEKIIHGPVIEFALSDSWIIGRTEKGWFAINKETHDVYYPYSKDQLQVAIGLDLSSMEMETDPIPYLIVRPEALAAKATANRLCWILLFVVPITLALGPLAVKKLWRGSGKSII